jgi:hypothetical protein
MTDYRKAQEMWAALPHGERLKAVQSFEALEEHAGNDWAALPPELQTKIIASMKSAEAQEKAEEPEEESHTRRRR